MTLFGSSVVEFRVSDWAEIGVEIDTKKKAITNVMALRLLEFSFVSLILLLLTCLGRKQSFCLLV